MKEKKPRPTKPGRGIFWLFLLLLFGLTIVVGWPLFADFSHHLYGAQNDALGSLWGLWWAKEALLNLRQLPTLSPYLAAHFGVLVPFVSPLDYLISLPTTAVFGPIFSYNILVLLSFFLSGLGMFLIIDLLTKNRWVALILGLLFALTPYHLSQSQSFLDLSQTQWLVFMVYFLLRFQKNKTAGNLLGVNIFLVLTILTSHYYAVFAAIILLLYLILQLTIFKEELKNFPRARKVLIINTLVYGAILLLGFIFFLFKLKGKLPVPPLFELQNYGSTRSWYYFLPAMNHPLLGDWARSITPGFSYSIQSINLGFLLVFLALPALVIKKIGQNHRFILLFFFLLLVIALLLSLKPVLNIGGYYLYLPSYFFFRVVPIIKILTRFSFLVSLSIFILAGLTFAHFGKFFSKTKFAVLSLIILGIGLFEFFPSFSFTDLAKIPPAYQWLKDQPPETKIIEYPFYPIHPWVWEQMFYQTIHRKITFNNYFFQTAYKDAPDLLSEMENLNTPQAAWLWQLLGVDYVIVQTKSFHQDETQTKYIQEKIDLEKIKAHPQLELVKEFPESLVFKVKNKPKEEIFALQNPVYLPQGASVLKEFLDWQEKTSQPKAEHFIFAKDQTKKTVPKNSDIFLAIDREKMEFSSSNSKFSFSNQIPVADNYEFWAAVEGSAKNEVYLGNKRVEIGKIAQGLQKITTEYLDPKEGKVEIVSTENKGNILADPSFETGLWDEGGVDRSPEAPGPSQIKASQSNDATDGRYSAELATKNHLVGIHRRLPKIDPQALYLVSFDYKHIKGAAPHFALWQDGINTGFPDEFLSTEPGWQHYEKLIKPDPKATFAIFYFFSDSDGTRETINLYDNVKMEEFHLDILPVALFRKGADNPKPLLSSTKISPSEYQVRVKASAPFFLVLPEKFEENWQVSLSEGEKVSSQNHYILDGWENSWLIEKIGEYELKIIKK